MRRLLLLLLFVWKPSFAAIYALPADGDNVVGYLRYVYALGSDTMAEVARREGVGLLNLLAANPGVDALIPGAGTRIVLPTEVILPPGPRRGIVINLAELRLFYYPPGGFEVMVFPIGIGKRGEGTPMGSTHIVSKQANPTWTPPANIRADHLAKGDVLPAVVPPGPSNPLGKYAMRLGFPGGAYLIHGTNKDYGVGMRVSYGCIRLFPQDIDQLFHDVNPGTPVRVINTPYKIGKRDGKVYIESTQPLSEQLDSDGIQLEAVLMRLLAGTRSEDDVDIPKALQVLAEERGIPTVVSSYREDSRLF